MDDTGLQHAAFPHSFEFRGGSCVDHGLTKREYMATHLLAGMLSDEMVTRNLGPEIVVRSAVRLTDMLLQELAK